MIRPVRCGWRPRWRIPPPPGRNARKRALVLAARRSGVVSRPSGQRELPLREHADSLVVPLAAVVRDVYGGILGLPGSSPRTGMREDGLPSAIPMANGRFSNAGSIEGTSIVTTGASELFGAEFGGAH